jgi:hypothetical protein
MYPGTLKVRQKPCRQRRRSRKALTADLDDVPLEPKQYKGCEAKEHELVGHVVHRRLHAKPPAK